MPARRPLLRRPDASGPPPFVVGLLVVELVAVVVLLIVGVGVPDLIKLGAPVITLTLALLSPTIQELGRRKPKLTITAVEADDHGVVAASALRPWPIDVDPVVRNEIADAQQSVDL